jgi:hypothetical protein
MAASTTVFATTPLLGLKLGDSPSSTPKVAALTKCHASDGKVYIYGKASEAIGSITTCKIGAAGSVSDDSGSAGWTANVPGGAATGQYFWLKRTTLA